MTATPSKTVKMIFSAISSSWPFETNQWADFIRNSVRKIVLFVNALDPFIKVQTLVEKLVRTLTMNIGTPPRQN